MKYNEALIVFFKGIFALDKVDEEHLYKIYNDYIKATGYREYTIWPMASFNEYFDGYTPLEIAGLVQGEQFDVTDNYFRHDDWGVHSAECVSELIPCMEDLVEWWLENSDNFLEVMPYLNDDDYETLEHILRNTDKEMLVEILKSLKK